MRKRLLCFVALLLGLQSFSQEEGEKGCIFFTEVLPDTVVTPKRKVTQEDMLFSLQRGITCLIAPTYNQNPLVALEGKFISLYVPHKPSLRWIHWLWPWPKYFAYSSGKQFRKERRWRKRFMQRYPCSISSKTSENWSQ